VRKPPPRSWATESGTITLYVVLSLIGLLGFTALSIDLGLAYNARTQAQAAVDGAMMAAAGNLIERNTSTVTLSQAEQTATTIASQNAAFPNNSLALDPLDLDYGRWDLDTRTLDTTVDLANADQVTGVRGVIRLDGTANQTVPTVLGRALGRDSFDVVTTATAYLGYAGSLGPGDLELPIAIPCCVLNGLTCEDDYCNNGAPIPNPCPLEQPQARGDNTVTCFQFQNTSDQTACWTELSGTEVAVNTSDLVDIVQNAVTDSITVDDAIFLDNGDKTPVVSMISDAFYGDGVFENAGKGSDTDGDGIIDSWITAAVVVSCQSEDHCAKGAPADVVGFVCMEIREITTTPDKIIRAQFLCKDQHPTRFQQCMSTLGTTGTGGLNFGIRASVPVLVQ
jgi:hypothetical protein